MTVKMTGIKMTSPSCSGTCLILSIDRHAKVSDTENGPGRGGRGRVDRTGARVPPSAWRGVGAGVVVMVHPPRRSADRPGLDGRSGRGTPRPGSADRKSVV